MQYSYPLHAAESEVKLSVERWASMALFLANGYVRGSLRVRPERCFDKAQFTESRLVRVKVLNVPPVIFGSASRILYVGTSLKYTVILELKAV